ncbi:NAD(P)/FAD-dependent oxidoreductase [Actinoallomurus iriomotensis]|uniref:Pyridine nucleotide-disulfide oxidoreductase n=1 Tax=Actinoallomurus iriomotensis TaxID=478107 RepID=A0A9W6VS47_9ACTN|nr:FAD-dependent oxidoreductase [Actinoallomurus iriomotensis]GLY77152.1 pyridine nucleotide-disulfide oxidoreductase [Actinoallomurus iriomotensis]
MGRTVAVVGGGYGGAAVAKALDEETDVVLVEPKDAFVHAAGSLRALVRPEWAGNIFFPYARLLRRGTVVRERAVSADAGGVTLASGRRVDADYLVLASGSTYPYPAKMDTDDSGEARERLRATHKGLADATRVLITGAGPVGLELSGEIKAVWPDKHVTVIDPVGELVPGFAPEMRADLRRQLDALGVEVRLGTTLLTPPPTEPGEPRPFTADVTGGTISADIWFRCHGVRPNSDYLDGTLTTARNARGQVRVTEKLNVDGHDRAYAIGDLTDLDEAKMAGHAMRHAEVVAQNILAQVRGEPPAAIYEPSRINAILLPLGPTGGVGQMPSPDGPAVLSALAVSERKGTDLYTGRFTALFGTA